MGTYTVTPDGVAPAAPKAAAPVKPVTPAPVEPAPHAEPQPTEAEAKLKAREDAIAAREKKYADQAKKDARDKNGLGAKLSRLAELEKESAEHAKQQQLAKLNPIEYLKSIYGEDYYKIITDTQVSGVPPAQLIASEIQKIREEFRSEMEAEKKKAAETQTLAQQQEFEEARNEVVESASRFYDEHKADYPVFEKFGNAKRIGEMLTSRIEAHFRETGILLSEQDAANGLEESLLDILDAAVQADKYKERLTPKPPSGKTVSSPGVPQGVQAAGRRTLTNNLTASSPSEKPRPRTQAEREQRAQEAWLAAHNRGG